jgi:hypothetical protein
MVNVWFNKLFIFMLILFSPLLYAQKYSCTLPNTIQSFVSQKGVASLKQYPDIRRNTKKLKNLCTYLLTFKEGQYRWDMLLVTHPKASHGAFWFLPHDNENTAFDSAVYAVSKYGGGFLSVLSGGKRYHAGQDPNRNFAKSHHKLSSCRYQKAASPVYTQNVFRIIDTFRGSGIPYLSLHNNTNGGGVSILRSSKSVHSFLAYPLKEVKQGRGLKDEDSLIYMAGKASTPPKSKLNRLLQQGIHVKYEVVTPRNNDCSMSNYVVIGKGSTKYYNIEAQHGDAKTQRKMIDILMGQMMR